MLRKYSQLLNPILKLNCAVRSGSKVGDTQLPPWITKYLGPSCCDVLGTTPSRYFHWSLPRCKAEDRRQMLASLPKPDEGTEGENTVDIDALVQRGGDIYPDKNTFTTLFSGIPFAEVPICHIRVSKNNTVMNITDAKGAIKLMRSCGVEGFKNARKGTNVAAQATAITFGTKALEKGLKTIRVKVQGIGPGRMSAIKGLQMSGLDIISITDNTPVSWNPPRPRKQRRL